MKKFLLLFAVMLVTLTLPAQTNISRELLGTKLGVSSKSVVMQKMKNAHYKLYSPSNEKLVAYNVKYANTTWDFAFFTFFNGKLLEVSFSKSGTDGEIKKLYSEIGKKLITRYESFYVEKILPQFSIDFNDGKTKVILSNFDMNDHRDLEFNFTDVNLSNLKEDGF